MTSTPIVASTAPAVKPAVFDHLPINRRWIAEVNARLALCAAPLAPTEPVRCVRCPNVCEDPTQALCVGCDREKGSL